MTMKNKPLSIREYECLELLKIYYGKHGIFPTQQYLADKMKIKHRQQVGQLLVSLLNKNKIRNPRIGMMNCALVC